MIRRLGAPPDELVQSGIALNICARADLATAIRIQRLLLYDLAADPDAVAELPPILFGGHIVEQNAWRFARMPRTCQDAPAAWRSHRAHMSLETVGIHSVGTVVADRQRQGKALNLRPFEALVRADEAAGLELVAGSDTGAPQQPLSADRQPVPPPQ